MYHSHIFKKKEQDSVREKMPLLTPEAACPALEASTSDAPIDASSDTQTLEPIILRFRECFEQAPTEDASPTEMNLAFFEPPESSRLAEKRASHRHLQERLNDAIRKGETKVVRTILDSKQPQCLVMTFEHMKSCYGLRGLNAYSSLTWDERSKEQLKIFSILSAHYKFSQEELDISLHLVSMHLSVSQTILKKLLEFGASPDCVYSDPRSTKQDSALRSVCVNGISSERYPGACKRSDRKSQIKAVQTLLEGGANPNLTFENDNTLLHCIVKELCASQLYPLPERFSSSILKALLQHGANPLLKNADGLSCFDLAGTDQDRFAKLCEKYAPNEKSNCPIL